MSTVKDIIEKGKAGYPAIYLQTGEDIRTTSELKAAAKELNRKLFIWTYGLGLVEEGKAGSLVAETDTSDAVLKHILDKKDQRNGGNEIYQLRLFSHWMDEPIIQSRLLDIIPFFKGTKRMLVITSPTVKLPPEVEKEFTLIESSLPTAEELRPVIDGIVNGSKLTGNLAPNPERVTDLLKAALGLTTSEAENALTLAYVRPRMNKTDDLWNHRIVLEEKCRALKKTGLLEYVDVSADGLNQVGGLEVLKGWVRRRKRAFTDEAKTFGLPPPCGILLVGPAGCGKSLTAKAVSGELNLPLLRLDMGKMFGSLVGQSEANMRQAIQIAEAVSPCILWIDEIEKGLAGSSGGSLDSGVGARVLGTILTWMQEKKSPVFVYATANDVSSLPPELLRKGRFDEIFSVSLPNISERKSILEIQLARRNRTNLLVTKKIQLDELAGAVSDMFTGAEIESVVKEALYTAFEAGRELEQHDLMKAFTETKPLAQVMPEKIDAIKRWCENRTRSANAPEAVEAKPVHGRGRAMSA